MRNAPPPKLSLPPAGALVLAILAFTVVASFGLLWIARNGADSALPEEFHWEGSRLDRDFDWARNAAQRRVQLFISFDSPGMCTARLEMAAPQPDTIVVSLVNTVDAALDQRFVLERQGEVYRAACARPARGRWHVTASAAEQQWRIRTVVESPAAEWRIAAMRD
jgi:hypothetical protein